MTVSRIFQNVFFDPLSYLLFAVDSTLMESNNCSVVIAQVKAFFVMRLKTLNLDLWGL